MKKDNHNIKFHTKLKNSCVSELQKGIDSLCKLDNQLHRIIAPVCTSLAPKLKKAMGIDSTFQNESYPFMSAHLNVNCQAMLPHIEHDVTYTSIFVMKKYNGKDITDVLRFNFRLNEDTVLKIVMYEGYSNIYSEMLLTHNQKMIEEFNIMNLSGYCNQRTFYHLRTTVRSLEQVRLDV